MKRSWIAAISFAVVSAVPAHAGPYSDASRVQQGCDAAGQIGVEAFTARAAYPAHSDPSFLHAEADIWMVQNNLTGQLGTTPIAKIAKKAVYYAFTRAPDAHSAYMYGWSRCMDEYGPQ